MRILIADDDPVNAKVLTGLLNGFGECVVVGDGLEALESFNQALVQNEPYDLICLDFMMPRMNGVDALQGILKEEKKRGINDEQGVKIFVTTALDTYKHTVESLLSKERGAYLVKPLMRRQLIAEMNRVGLFKNEKIEKGEKKRVMIVDDSSLIRHVLSDVISKDDHLEVSITATNGKEALEKMAVDQPDIVILDYEMPELNGLQTLEALKRDYKKIPVVMFSSWTQKGAEITLEALSLGASDYALKPTSDLTGEERAEFFKEFVQKIKGLCGIVAPRSETRQAPPVSQGTMRTQKRIDVVAIGISTGGPPALDKLLSPFPDDFPIPIMIVQHMPATFTAQLARSLDDKTALNVQEAAEGDVLEAGKVLIAPGGYHLSLKKTLNQVVATLNEDPPENSCRPAADVLFRAVAELYGQQALAVVMTGLGQDGLKGCEAINREQGHVLIQDKESSVVWGMPGAVANADLADDILSLDDLSQEIIRRSFLGRHR